MLTLFETILSNRWICCVEILVNYNPKLHFLAEWWKQLYGESEGKDLKELADKLNINAKEFEASIKKYNQAVETGLDEEFGRKARNLFSGFREY